MENLNYDGLVEYAYHLEQQVDDLNDRLSHAEALAKRLEQESYEEACELLNEIAKRDSLIEFLVERYVAKSGGNS